MQFVKPMPFTEAVDKLNSLSPIGSTFTSSEWADLPVELRENAFFSAGVENVRFLQAMQDSIKDYLEGNRKTLPDGQTLLATGGRSAFIDQMQKFLTANGIERTDGSVRDITSERRLGLIFDIKTQQAGDYGYWRQGMDPDVLNEFPAQRFIRVKDVKEPRETHSLFQDQVYLKTDPIWALEINKDFGVPWGPWGWGCGHDVEDVARDEAESLGLIKPGQTLTPPKKFFNLNKNLQASTHGLAPELIEKLKNEFGDRIKIADGMMSWQSRTPATVETPAVVPAGRVSPVSEALQLKVHGNLKTQVSTALDAIDLVHDDGDLPEIPLTETKRTMFGYFQSQYKAGGSAANKIAIRQTGNWPALTTVHEVGHFLDLEAIGPKGTFASIRQPIMKDVMDAANSTDAIRALRSGPADTRTYYLLKPQEIWARAYAQFIAEKSNSPLLVKQLKDANDADPNRQWTTEDFAPLAAAMEKMFQQLGWL